MTLFVLLLFILPSNPKLLERIVLNNSILIPSDVLQKSLTKPMQLRDMMFT